MANPDPANIKDSDPARFEVYPSGNAPPSGAIVVLPKAAYADGQSFSIDDGSNPPVTFYIKTTDECLVQEGSIVIDLTVPTVLGTKEVALAIAGAVRTANLTKSLRIEASAEPTVDANMGRVYLTYDFTSDLASAGNDVVISNSSMPAGSISPWIPGGPTNDVRNIQWAIDNVQSGGTVVLKQYAANTSMLSPFNFGRIGRLEVARSVRLEGEFESQAGFDNVGAGGWVLSGTTILGGTQMVIGRDVRVTYSIRNIIFDGFYAGAMRVNKSQGYNEISGCHFRNFIRGRVVNGTVVGAFPMIIDGGRTGPEADDCGGTLKILHNYFGKLISGTDPATPSDNFNNLMHFSNCNLDLEIRGNEIEDCLWGGFMVFGNKGYSRITHNTITKTRSYLEGAAISIGGMTGNFVPLDADVYTGNSEVTDNRITINSANSSAINITAYPSDLQHPSIEHVVSNNVIFMNGSHRGALACTGDCSHTRWTGNIVTGSARYGISIIRSVPSVPFAQLPDTDTEAPHDNLFTGNNLEGLTASVAQVFVEYAYDNTFRDNEHGTVGSLEEGTPHRGLAGAYVTDSHDNTFVNEAFLGDYPGTMDSAENPLPEPLPCMWLAAGAINNKVVSLKLGQGPQNFDICTQVFLSPGASPNDVKGYQKCRAVPASVSAAMADRETHYHEWACVKSGGTWVGGACVCPVGSHLSAEQECVP